MNPEAYQTRTYSSEKLIWRLRVDLEARILITTRHSYGLGVHDLDSGEMLWELMRVRPSLLLPCKSGRPLTRCFYLFTLLGVDVERRSSSETVCSSGV
jgi:hypothetical protein